MQARSDRTCLLAAHGWNIEHRHPGQGFWFSTPSSDGWNDWGRRVGCVARCWVLRDRTTPGFWFGGDGFFRPSRSRWLMIRWVWGFWPSVENYIVDASILDSGLRSWITIGESHWMTSFGVLFGVFTGQFLSALRCRRRIRSNSCDFKFLRANGGCLGIWSRRRTS